MLDTRVGEDDVGDEGLRVVKINSCLKPSAGRTNRRDRSGQAAGFR